MVQHDVNHQKVKKNLDESLINRIKEMCIKSSPGQILKLLKSDNPVEELLDLTLSQVIKTVY